MFEARLAGNLQGSPKYWYGFSSLICTCFVILSAIYRSLRFISGIETTVRTLVESHEERGKKHWRFWEVATLGERFWSAYWGRWGATCWWNISSNSPVWESHWWVSAVFEKSMGYLWIFFHCINRFVAFSSTKSRWWFQICCLVLDLGHFFDISSLFEEIPANLNAAYPPRFELEVQRQTIFVWYTCEN